jgi:hypothetical protein
MDKIYSSTTSVLRSDYRKESEYRQALRDAMQHYNYRVQVFGGWKFFETGDRPQNLEGAEMTERRGKAYTEYLRAVAFEIVAGRLEMDGREAYRALAVELVQRTGCAYMTARQHIAYAFRVNRNPAHQAREWGGARDGAGRPRKVEES